MTETLLSEKNPLLKQVRRAIAKGSLTEDGFAIAEGPHLFMEALASKCEIHAVLRAESSADGWPPTDGIRVEILRDRTFAAMASTENSQGVMTLVRPPVWKLEQMVSGALIAIIDGVQDPGNAGAIVRAAEAFGATGVILLRGSANPYNPKAMRASAGSIFRLPLLAHTETDVLLGRLSGKVTIYSAAPRGGTLIGDVDLTAPCAIVIGAEGRGVGASLLDRSTRVRIPTLNVESLNAAVAAGVMLYEAQRQRSR